ncbi:MAG: efflux RND transporter periplasmic adaptor subunit [Gammaproteobacteria bacterium]|nr:efflux RND transporter periplasmic adaptor subunit [Gammaproteobacteria bacterium]MDH3751878.1 efflux RND transporter periplasmic adaptor subunit [Gammaproteobacteria bacterium]MDH3804791.1 efflux RND transporter periplasmic adaptor subunit [Gammaproteobacteria bacterium]
MKPVYRKFVLIPGIIVGAAALSIGMSQFRPEQPKRDDEKLDLLVEVLPLEVSTESFRIGSQGTVRPRTQTVLSAEVTGSIVSISPKFVAGGVFGKGEVLMRVDPTNYTVAVDKAEALVKQRQIEYDGARKLLSQGYRAESEFASAAAALASAQAELVSAGRNLERTFIRLPYEGMVLSKDTDIGQFVNPGSQLGVTFATDLAEVRLPLTDLDLAFVDMPNAAEVTETGSVDGPKVKLSAVQKGEHVEWDAQIVRSEGVVDERSRVTYAVAQIADPYHLHSEGTPLPIGTFVAASISGSTVLDVIRIPRTALRGSNQVLIVDDENTIEIRTVDVIRSDNRYAYVSGGVSAGERITTTAIEAPVNGMPVRTAESVAEADGDEQIASRVEED